MKHIKNTTLIIVDTLNHGRAFLSLQKSLKQCSFDKVLFFTNIKMRLNGIDVIQIPELKSKDDYSRWILKSLAPYITTNYVLVTQHDSWILNGDLFPEELYKYDFAGALWIEVDGLENGNGGMSWRSKKLIDVVHNDKTIEILTPEDVAVCRVYRRYLEHTYGLKWAPNDVCERFSFECIEPVQPTFAFHNFFHEPYKEAVVVRRWAALGDVIGVEPLLRHLYNKGYRVFLDCIPDFFFLFLQHDYKIEHFSNINPRLPYKLIELDGSYESKPKQLHLKSYYEAAGIFDGELVRPRLNFKINEQNKLFKKTVAVHYSPRGQGGRNIYGLDWDRIGEYLISKGYDVIIVGAGENVKVKGALEIKTVTLNLLQYVVASCDLFIGCDSGVSHIAVAQGVPSIIFFGNVEPQYIHPDLSNICVIQNDPKCEKYKCWHETIGTEGMKCYLYEEMPPCSIFDTEKTIKKIDDFICQKLN